MALSTPYAMAFSQSRMKEVHAALMERNKQDPSRMSAMFAQWCVTANRQPSVRYPSAAHLSADFAEAVAEEAKRVANEVLEELFPGCTTAVYDDNQLYTKLEQKERAAYALARQRRIADKIAAPKLLPEVRTQAVVTGADEMDIPWVQDKYSVNRGKPRKGNDL
jgi:hypothetical protein